MIQQFLSVSRFHIVAIAAMGTFTFGWLFTGHYPWLLAGICALDWFIVNLLNRVVDLEEDKANKIRGTSFVDDNRKTLTALGFSLLLLSFIGFYFLVPAITPYRVFYHILGLTYNWPLLPGGRRIKELYFFKNAASAVGFILTVFCYPLAAYWSELEFPTGITTATVIYGGIFFFLFELSYEVIYDLRDVAGDRQAGVQSYPVVHGEQGAKMIIDGLIITSLVVLIIGYLSGPVPWRLLIMGTAPLIQLGLYKGFLKRGITSADCVAITWLGTSLLILYHLWVVAGLPGVGLKT